MAEKKGKLLIAYFSASGKNRPSNEDKAVLEIEKHFAAKGFLIKKILIQPRKKMGIKEQFKQEKNLSLKASAGMKGYDLVIIGTPIVGSLTSAPIVNVFVRSIPKQPPASKTLFALFSAGVVHGFELRKLQSLLSMKGIKPVEAHAFTSMFDFDSKKLAEVRQFAEKLTQKLED